METIALTFGEPSWFWGLLALPLLAVLYGVAYQRGRQLISKVVAPRLCDELAASVSSIRRVIRAALVLATFALILIALAQPRYGFIQQEIKQKGRDIVIAVDTSRSMLATDVAPDRLARAKLLAQDLLRLLKGDRVGLIAFAGSAFLQAPLTLDYSAVINSLDELDTTVIPKGGTNIAAAISTAEQAFGKAEGQTRALVILTDGEELDADSISAAKKATELGVRIFTVGIGSADGSLIPFRAENGRQDFVRDRNGKPVQSRLDVTRLQEIASATGGFYVPLGPDAAREIFQKGIEPMDLLETGVFAARQPLERYQWPLSFAVGFLILWLLLGERRKVRNGKKRSIVTAAAALLLAAAHTSAGAVTGIQDYQSGHFDKARQSFEQQLKSEPNSRELQFNAGTSAYKLGDFPQAVSYFTSALLSEDKKMREEASYNLANALVRRGESAKENSAKKADWKNAIEHYTEALNLDPKNKNAEENRAIVKKLLEDLENKEKQEEKKDDKKQDQKQDQKNDKDQKQDEQNKDQSKDQKDQQQQDKQKEQDQQDKQEQQKQDQQGGQKDQEDKKNDQQNQPDKKDAQEGQNDKEGSKGDQKDEKKNEGQQNKQDSSATGEQNKKDKQDKQSDALPTPTPGDKKEGALKENSDQNKDQKPQESAAAAAAEEEKGGEMSAAQARGLLNSLRSEEEKVNLMQQQTSEDVLRDW